MKNKFVPIILSFILAYHSFLPWASFSVFAQSNQAIVEGNKYAKVGHEAYKQKAYLKSAQNYEKAYQLTKAKVYADNVKVAYTSYAFELANDKNYDKAIFYSNKVLATNPNDTSIKELLSDIYFSRGADYFYTGELEKAKADFNLSMKFSVAPDQKERIKDALAKIQSVSNGNVSAVPQYQESSDTSIPEMVTAIENKVSGVNYKAKPLLERVSKLEKEALGKTYEADGLIIRVDRLKRNLMPESAVQQAPRPYDNTYIPAIMDQSMGRVTVFGKMPISVFIDDADVKPYKKFYRDAVIEGMKEWEKASEDKIKFQVISEAAKSEIKIVWVENFEDFPWLPTLQKDDISAEKERIKYKKANTLVQIGSVAAMVAGGLLGVPIIGGLGGIGNGIASPLLQYKGMNTERSTPDLKINVKITDGMTDEQAKAKIKQIAIHQIGHAIGIIGHSPNPNDIMYQNFTATQLSEPDINTIREIYKSKDPVK